MSKEVARYTFDSRQPWLRFVCAGLATAIIDGVDQTPAPLRMVLGSQALAATLKALEGRLADFQTQEDLAASTDYPPGE